MEHTESLCIDVGTENCPCPLALTKDCLICGKLQERNFCDCDWAGVCIYNEFFQNGNKIKNLRSDKEVPVAEFTYYSEALAVIKLKVSPGFALKARRPGAFVFVRHPNRESWYNVPISVMRSDVDSGLIHLAVEKVSVKTKNIFEEAGTLVVRGIYRNGLIGGPEMMKSNPNRLLVVCKGVGFAPAANFLELYDKDNKADIIIDPEKINGELIRDYIPDSSGGTINYADLKSKRELEKIEKMIAGGDYDGVLVCASSYYVEKISGFAKQHGRRLAYSNNAHMCCGEGICGSCTSVDSKGCSHKMCKCCTCSEAKL